MSELLLIVKQMTIAIESNSIVNDELLISLVDNLILSEVKPGGPYLNEGRVDIILNARIFKLFVLLKKPLPNVESYLKNHIEQTTPNVSTELLSIMSDISNTENNLHIEPISLHSQYNFFHTFTNTLSSELQKPAIIIGRKIIESDINGEITKLALIFSDSIKKPQIANSDDLRKIGEANFLVWVAYSIYDSVIDGDISPGALSTANVFIRESIQAFKMTLINSKIVFEYMAKVDSANAWETTHCRFVIDSKSIKLRSIPGQKDLEKMLSDRAIAHVIGPMCVIDKMNLNKVTYKKTEDALKYYCIARQLNDDLHDWVEDYKNGRMTYVVRSLLVKSDVTIGSHDSEKILKSLKQTFYNSELNRLCQLTESFIDQSINLLKDSQIMDTDSTFINSFLKPIKESALKARNNHALNKTSVVSLNTYLG